MLLIRKPRLLYSFLSSVLKLPRFVKKNLASHYYPSLLSKIEFETEKATISKWIVSTIFILIIIH